MKKAGWKTHVAFAYCVAPNSSGSDKQFAERVVVPLLGSEADPLTPVLRQFNFDSYTLAAAELQRRVERTGEEPPRELPRVERERRRDACQARLTGVKS